MKKNVWIYGLILGGIVSLNMAWMAYVCYTRENFEGSDVTGYASMIIIFSLIFVAIRSYRNKQLNGAITFGRAFKMGALIALIASSMYVITWLFLYYLYIPDFLDKYIPHALNKAVAEGATPSEIAVKTEEMAKFREMYKNPFFLVLITYSEILPVALLIALISSLILKKKPKPEAAA